MALFDSLCDALELIEEWEGKNSCDKNMAAEQSPFVGHPWDELRKIKTDMNILMMKRGQPIQLFDDADYEWLRAEVLKRVAKKPPSDFDEAFTACCTTLWDTRYPTRDSDIAHHRKLKKSHSPLPQSEEL